MSAQKTTQNTETDVVSVERADGIYIITLNRPQAMNAVNSVLAERVGAALEELNSDPELRVGIITGAGRAFCAGADLKAIAAGESVDPQSHPEWGFGGVAEHYIDKPLIAAVNGLALGGGTEIVLACDLAVMSEEASLGLPEVRRGLFAAAGGVIRLPRQMPPKVAAEAVLTGDPISARAALQWGLVNRVVAAADVLGAARELAGRIARNAPLSLKTSKDLMHRAAAHEAAWDRDVWQRNQDGITAVFASADAREGSRAFAEKREPRWSGR